MLVEWALDNKPSPEKILTKIQKNGLFVLRHDLIALRKYEIQIEI